MTVPTQLALVQNLVGVLAASNQPVTEELNRVAQAVQGLINNANATIAAQAAENAALRGRIEALHEHHAHLHAVHQRQIGLLTNELMIIKKELTGQIALHKRDIKYVTKLVHTHRHKIPSGENTGSYEEHKAATKT